MGRGRLEDVSFYNRFLSRPVNAQFHSHLEITSAKNKSTKFQLYYRKFLVWTDIGKYVLVSARHGFTEFNFFYIGREGERVLKRFPAS